MPRIYAVVLTCVLAGCGVIGDLAALGGRSEEPELLALAYRAADHLHDQLAGGEAAGYPMLAAAFVDSRDVEITSDVGRLLSEQIASRLSQHGYSLAEIQLRADQLAVRPDGGVFALSRELGRINADAEAYSILLGTYTVIERQIYVNARVLRTSDGVALASSDFSLPYIRQARSGQHAAVATPSVGTKLE